MRHLLASVAVLGLIAAPAMACDGHKNATMAKTDAGAAKADCCAHKADMKAQGKDCPHAAKMAKAAEGQDTVAPAVLTDTTAKAADGQACPYAKLKENADHGCKKSAAILAAAREVKEHGHVVCARCDLHTAESCRSVFQTADGSTMPLCGDGISADLLRLTKHGEVDVTVHGKLVGDEGEKVLCVQGFSVGTI